MRLTYPRLMFIVVAGAAFVLTGNLARIGRQYGVKEMEYRRQLASFVPATVPTTGPATLPSDYQDKLLEERQKLEVKANNLGAQKLQLYLFSGLLTALWGIAAVKTWKRRWPGDQD